MQLQKITSNIHPGNRTKENDSPSFKSRLTFDIGASDPRSTLKLLVQDNDGQDLFEYKGFVNDSTKGFQDGTDFITKLAGLVDIEGAIARDRSTLEERIRANGLSEEEAEKAHAKLKDLTRMSDILAARTPEERKLTGLSLLLPGTLKGKTALFMANIRKTDGKSLTGVNLKELISEVIRQGKVKLSDNFDPHTDFVACKDLAGTGIGVTEKLVNDPKYGKYFQDGFFASIVQTGGGFGAVNVKVNEDLVGIETSECSHDLFKDPQTGAEIRLGELGTSTSSVIKNYAKKIGIVAPDDLKALVETGNAMLATCKQVKFDNTKDAKAIKVLLDTGVYEVQRKNRSMTTLAVKDSHAFETGSANAVKAYAEALALHAITRITRGVNLYVLSGPLAMGLNDRVKEAPALFGAPDMRSLILQYIDQRVGKDLTCNLLREANNFDIICDRALSSENNTRGGSLLLSQEVRKNLKISRGEWINIPLQAMKTLGKY